MMLDRVLNCNAGRVLGITIIIYDIDVEMLAIQLRINFSKLIFILMFYWE